MVLNEDKKTRRQERKANRIIDNDNDKDDDDDERYGDDDAIGSFSNDNSDSYENVETAIGLLNETSSLHIHHTFLYISLPLLHD